MGTVPIQETIRVGIWIQFRTGSSSEPMWKLLHSRMYSSGLESKSESESESESESDNVNKPYGYIYSERTLIRNRIFNIKRQQRSKYKVPLKVQRTQTLSMSKHDPFTKQQPWSLVTTSTQLQCRKTQSVYPYMVMLWDFLWETYEISLNPVNFSKKSRSMTI